MRKLIGGMVAVAVLTALPVLAQAQRRAASSMGGAKHEFGLDVGLAYSSPDGGDAFFTLGTPVDVRIGFVGAGKVMFEPRFTLAYTSDVSGGGGVGAGHNFDLGLNVLYGKNHRAGMYFTGGAAIDLLDLGGGGETFLSLNGGIGTRKAYGSGALRYEAFLRYDLENTDAGTPSVISIGVRAGISLWH